jgi:hypothetical protein
MAACIEPHGFRKAAQSDFVHDAGLSAISMPAGKRQIGQLPLDSAHHTKLT